MVPALIAAIASVRSQRSGTAPSSSKVRACTSLGSTRMRMPLRSAGVCSGAQPVRDVAEAVLEIAEDAIIHPRLDPLGEIFAERAVDGGARLIALLEQKRQIDKAELGHAVGQIARRLIAEREHAVLDQPQNLFGAVAEIHDVPDILDVDAVAELRLQRVADQFERA